MNFSQHVLARRDTGPGGVASGREHTQLRFAAFMSTLDEMDILPANIEQLRRIGVDAIYVFDYGSVDGTLEYLADIEAAGDVWVINVGIDDDFDVVDDARTVLAREADVDWILFLDTDEFWLPRHGSLQQIGGLEDSDVLHVARYNVVVGPDGPVLPRSTHAAPLSEIHVHALPIPNMARHLGMDHDAAWIVGLQMPSVMARPSVITSLAPGDHDVRSAPGESVRRAYTDEMIVAHAGFRTLEQFERKAASIRKAVDAFPEYYTDNQGWQWRRWAEMHRDGQLAAEFERQMTSPVELQRLLGTGEVRSAEEILTQAVPDFETESDYRLALTRAQPWLTAAAMALQHHGIDTGTNLKMVPGGMYPTVMMNPDHVVKLYGRWDRGHGAKRTEVAGLRLLEEEPALPVPRLIGEGELTPEWHYLVESKVPGEPLSGVRDELIDGAMNEVATSLGDFIRKLRAIPLKPEDRTRAAQDFGGFIEARHANLSADLAAGRALPDHLLAQLDAWLPPLTSLIDDAIVPLHGDLNDEHIFGQLKDGRFRIFGIIDFNRFRIGQGRYEIGPIWQLVFRGDAAALRTFIRTAALDDVDDPEFPRRALAWCLLHQGVAQFPIEIPGLERVRSLDELADATFGEGGVLPRGSSDG